MRLMSMIASPVVAFVAGALAAQVIVPGVPLEVVPFSSGPGEMPAFPGTANPYFTAFFYTLANVSGNRVIVSYDAAGNPTIQSPVSIDFGVLDFGRGASWGRLFVAEQGFPSGVAADGIYELTSGFMLTPFSLMGGGNPDPNDVEFPGGAFGTEVLVANPSAGCLDPNFNLSIARLTTTGAFVGVLHADARGPFFMAASSGASFGNFVYCSYLNDSAVDRIAPNGTVSRFTNLGGNGAKIAFGLGGAFGQDLYAADQLGSLYRVDTSGTATLIATGLIGTEFAFDPATGDMIARTAGYVRIRGVSASCALRNGTGVNPVACTCSTLPVLGTTWQLAITPGTGTLRTFAFASATSIPPVPLPFGEILISPPLLEIPGNGTHSVSLPSNPLYLGLLLYVQGLRQGPNLNLQLTNAQDAVVGF